MNGSPTTTGADASCSFCGGARRSTIDTYKHRWIACDSCGNIVCRPKQAYLAERLLPPRVSSWLASTKMPYVRSLRMFFADRRVLEARDAAWEYLPSELDKGVENTKYKGLFENYVAFLARHEITLTNRDVLDVSGGPGFIVHQLSKLARRAVMTEYNRDTVVAAREKLGIETAYYDFNEHDIAATVSGEFDFVFVRNAINYCLDVPKFLRSLTKLLRPGAHVFVSFVLPSMGTCLRWQFNEDALSVLYNPETMTRMFAEARFRVVAREDEARHDYREGASRLPRAIFPVYEMKNRFFSGVGAILRQDTVIHLYRYEP
jgi:2-polyprenyl-3-methyl-5-hydroxy-6-metoxy-1,4-benzoquinol methylase